MENHTVKGVHNLSLATESFMDITNVRIPMFKKQGRPMSATDFGRELKAYLNDTYAIKTKVTTKGLGELDIIIANE